MFGLVPFGGTLGGSGGGGVSPWCASAAERGGRGGTGSRVGLLGSLRGGHSTGTITGFSLS